MAGSLTTFFPSAPGVDTGRTEPDLAAPPEGDFVAILGSETPGSEAVLDVGDFVEIAQTMGKGTDDVLTCRAILIGPRRMPVVTAEPPFALADGQTLVLLQDGTERTVTFSTDDFVSIGAATGQEVATVLARDLDSEFAINITQNERVVIDSTQTGASSEIFVTGGTAVPALDFLIPRWRLLFQVNDVTITSRDIRPGDFRNLSDIGVPLAPAAISSEYALRLQLDDVNGETDPGALFRVGLPCVYIDDLIFDDFTGLMIINRDPEQDEINVRIGRPLQFDVISDAAAIDTSDITVSVTIGSGTPVTVLENGVFASGWDGPLSTIDTIAIQHVHVVLDHTEVFPGETLISITITVGALQQTYTFTTEDVDPPGVLTASALDPNTIRVVFDEPVADDVLIAANWNLEPQAFPAVSPTVIDVVRVLDDRVDLILDLSMSPLKPYLLSVTSVDDLAGNDSGPLSVLVIGFWCPQPALRRFLVRDLIPDINKFDRDVLGDLAKFLSCLQDIVDILLCDIDRWVRIFDVDIAPIEFVDAMLADLGNPFSFELDDRMKRLLARTLTQMYRKKGTSIGIIEAIEFFLGITVTITSLNIGQTWVLGISELGIDTDLGAGEQAILYSFDVDSPVTLTDAQREQMLEIIDYLKPAHTHLRNLNEPEIVIIPDHLELGLSELGTQWDLH